MDKNTSSGISFTGALLIDFIVLKLCSVINWSWWWVLSPLWIPIALFIIIGIVWLVLKIKTNKKMRNIRKIMNSTGKNEYAATIQYKYERGIVPKRSAFLERLEEIAKQRKK